MALYRLAAPTSLCCLAFEILWSVRGGEVKKWFAFAFSVGTTSYGAPIRRAAAPDQRVRARRGDGVVFTNRYETLWAYTAAKTLGRQ